MKFTAIKPEDDKSKTVWLKDGQILLGVFRGDIHDFKIHWVDKKKVKCAGDGCEHCNTGLKSNFQFKVNFVYKDNEGKLQTGIYEQDWFTYQRLNKLNNQYPLEDNVIKIYKGMEGTYKVDLFDHVKSLDAETLKMISDIPLIDLYETNDRYAKQDHKEMDEIPF